MTFARWIDCLIVPLCVGVCALLSSRRCLHFFQLESYQFRGYFRALSRQKEKAFLRFVILAGAAAVLRLLTLLGLPWLRGVLALALIGAGLFVYRSDAAHPGKKPLKFTARVKRLCVSYSVVALALHIGAAFLFGSFAPSVLLAALSPCVLVLGAAAVWPVERGIYEFYFRSARKILLSRDGLIRIGITGSFGKTSNKFILETLLKEKYSVLTTPGSFNTPMGLCRVIRERLQPGHQVFIAEMGARHRGDIRELCRLVKPQIGMLTAVGAQHLDTFGTVDRIAETKYDLIRALPPDGLAVFMDDGARVKGLYERTTGVDTILSGREGDDAWADQIACDGSGSHFDIHFRDEEEVLHCSTGLLGRMNIDNITACAALAKKMGVSLSQLRRGISRLRPVEHRMQLVSSAGGITVIDDAFNSNPVSSSLALDTLKLFSGRRVVVTPGMVELGKDEDEYNKAFGVRMASCADEVLLVGEKHTLPIREGLLQEGFPAERIHVFGSLNDAVKYLRSIEQPGDVVLYENDLPDNYA